MKQDSAPEKKLFSNISYLLSNKKYEEAQGELSCIGMLNNELLQRQLIDYIVKDNSYFFSIKLQGFQSVKEVEDCMTQSQKIILNNLSINNQLRLMCWSLEIRDILNIEHIRVLKIEDFHSLSPTEKKIFLDLTVAYFNKEDFESINYIRKNIYSPILDLESQCINFHYRGKYSKGYSNTHIRFSFPIAFNVFINFSQNKIDFFQREKISLIEQNVINDFLSSLKSIPTDLTHGYLFKIEDLEKRINDYFVYTEKYNLTAVIKDKVNLNQKIAKI